LAEAYKRGALRAETLHLTRKRFIVKEEEQTYIEVPFELMDQGYERIEIRYSYDNRASGSVVDIGLKSPERIVGWSGGARDSFFVGLEKATPGYLSGPITAGSWAVLLGAYRVPEAGCSVTVDITAVPARGRWLKGDLHMHTVHSDGSYTPAEVISLCTGRGLDFIALTDHNTASQNRFALAADERLLIIPGVELTSYKGHANLLGQPDALQDFRVLTPETAASELWMARDKGAFVSLNHPFCDNCPWELGFDVPYDAIEVWNGPWRELNEKAVQWWQEQLSRGERIVALGGSDTHRAERFVMHGRPTASIWTMSDTVQGLLDGMRQGRVVLSFDPQETFITLSSGELGIGDSLTPASREASVPLRIEAAALKGDRISLWSDQGVEAEWTADNEQAVYVFEGAPDRLFYRVEARRYIEDNDRMIMTCLTNPLYIARTV